MLGEELRRRLLLNLLPRPLLILQAQSDLALVHCPSINRGNLEGKQTNKQTNKWRWHVQMQGVVQSCVACGVQCTICQSTQRSFGDASEMHWKSMEFDTQGHTLTEACSLWNSVHQFPAQFFCRTCPNKAGWECHSEFVERWTSWWNGRGWCFGSQFWT